MNSTQLRQTINHYLDRLSSNRLRLVADFLNLLVRTEHPEQTLVSETPDFRPPTGGSLLSHTETWAGEDFDECLETVYETRFHTPSASYSPDSQQPNCRGEVSSPV